ncbi:MAG TPA: hypothetical protein VGH42_10435 [Verrucomicrobiae bacterium]|jgi:hypothetical protein
MKIPNQTNGYEPEFQMEGNIVYLTECRSQFGTEQVKHSRHFVVARKGQQWKIRTTNLHEDEVANGIKYDEMGCDGATIYELKSFDENNPEFSNVKDILTAQGRVRHGNALVGLNLDFIYPLWIAYCSSSYFLSRKDNRIAAPLFIIINSFLDAVPTTLSLPAKWKLNDSNFISEIAWHSEGIYLHVNEGGSRLKKYPPPFDAGFLHANFETTDWISFSKMRMPSGFKLTVFGPNWPVGGEAKCTVSYTVEAKIQAVHPLQNFSFVPELTKKTRITDTRYRLNLPYSGHPTYAGLAWMTEEEVEAKNKSLGIKYEKQTS